VTSEFGIGLIPARGGSKGVPNKNIAPLLGKPLLQYTLEAGFDSRVLSRLVVSSDSPEICGVAARFGAEIVDRPASLATDEAKSDDVIAHFIAAAKVLPDAPIVLLQPTSPLRTSAHIAAAMELWRSRAPRGVISVYEPDEHPAKSFRLDQDGFLTGLYGPDAPFTPRQMLPRGYQPNGAIYIFSVSVFLEANCIPRTGLLPFLMDVRSSLDIDKMEDLAEAERRLQERR
jgi:N-acylneuraminate cytidylyltransferase